VTGVERQWINSVLRRKHGWRAWTSVPVDKRREEAMAYADSLSDAELSRIRGIGPLGLTWLRNESSRRPYYG
jgi:hypothetical protein